MTQTTPDHIDRIKAYRSRYGCDLKTAKAAVEGNRDHLRSDVSFPVWNFRLRMWGMFFAGMWFAQFVRWAIGGFHV